MMVAVVMIFLQQTAFCQLRNTYVVARNNLTAINPAALHPLTISHFLDEEYFFISNFLQSRPVVAQDPMALYGGRLDYRMNKNQFFSLELQSEDVHITTRTQFRGGYARLIHDGIPQSSEGSAKTDRTFVNFGGNFHLGWVNSKDGELQPADQDDPLLGVGGVSQFSGGVGIGLFILQQRDRFGFYVGPSANVNRDFTVQGVSRDQQVVGLADFDLRPTTTQYHLVGGLLYKLDSEGGVIMELNTWLRTADFEDTNNFLLASGPILYDLGARFWFYGLEEGNTKSRERSVAFALGWTNTKAIRGEIAVATVKYQDKKSKYRLRRVWSAGLALEYPQQPSPFGNLWEFYFNAPLESLFVRRKNSEEADNGNDR